MLNIWPHETSELETLWLAWPSDPNLWKDKLETAQNEVLNLISCLEENRIPVSLIVHHAHAYQQAESCFKQKKINLNRIIELKFGDIWLRDIAPLFVQTQFGIKAVCFQFNGWGQKYLFPDDQDFAIRLAQSMDMDIISIDDFICEGGALEGDGQGTLITTRQCLLNKNRNPNLSERDIERILKKTLGIERVIWLDEGLVFDHTDGHVDNLVRFVRPGLVVCQKPKDQQDPNLAIYDHVRRELDKARDANGAPIEFAEIISPGRILDASHSIMPASHMNMILTPNSVIMPVYDLACGREALKSLSEIFKAYKVIGFPSSALLTGGGSFHCISQHQWKQVK